MHSARERLPDDVSNSAYASGKPIRKKQFEANGCKTGAAGGPRIALIIAVFRRSGGCARSDEAGWSVRVHSNPMLKRSFASMPSNEARLRANTQNLTDRSFARGGQAWVARAVPDYAERFTA